MSIQLLSKSSFQNLLVLSLSPVVFISMQMIKSSLFRHNYMQVTINCIIMNCYMFVSVEESHIFHIWNSFKIFILEVRSFFSLMKVCTCIYIYFVHLTVYIQCLTVICLHFDACISASVR